jgi:hypothetical protein
MSWLSRWKNSPATGRPRPTGTRATSNRRRPRLEALENRALLTTYTVDWPDVMNVPSGHYSLRTAINKAKSDFVPDTIDLPPGTYNLNLGLLEINDPAKVTIESASQTLGTSFISAQMKSGVFKVDSGSQQVEFDHLVIEGGNTGDFGGGINNYGTVTINDCEFWGNTAGRNGGGLANFGNATVSYSDFDNNSAANGGGVYNRSVLTANGCGFSGNTAKPGAGDTSGWDGNGGGLMNDGVSSRSSMTINDCSFTTNSADNWGGGLYGAGMTTIKNQTTFENNTARYGGGVANGSETTISGTMSISDARIYDNRAVFGGGIYSYDATSLSVANSRLTFNTASQDGGGIYSYGTTSLQITNSTITANSANDPFAANPGGGLYCVGPIKIDNLTQIAFNHPTDKNIIP